MQRILSRARQIQPKHAALFLVIAALVVAIVYLTGREAAVDQHVEAAEVVVQERPAEPPQQDEGDDGEATAEPLTLTLSAPQICEAQHPRGGWAHGLAYDEDGNRQDIVADAWWYWGAEGTVEAAWAVSGGDGSYTVTIAGEAYTGASGTAEVSCALQHGPVIDHPEHGRTYADDDKPLVDSGLKTIRATVTDSTGATAEATADVYVILVLEDSDHVMKSGETYRVRGWLVTVPDGIDIDSHRGVEEVTCVNIRADGTVDKSINCEDSFHLAWTAPEYYAYLSLGMTSGEESGRTIWWLDNVDASDESAVAAARALYREVDAKLSDLAASVGQPPKFARE